MTTHKERQSQDKRYQITKGALDEVDERFSSSKWLVSALDKIFPDHWSFMVGEIAMDSLIILIVTGIYLALYYVPSSTEVVYAPTSGVVYHPLVGHSMSEAYQSVINLSFNVRFGLIMRQAHHWAALIFLAAVFFHMARIFFTGAFRKPREINWIIGLLLWQIVALEGFTGYSLPDDLLSGDGLRVIYSIIQTIPFIGTWLSYALWGGRFPGTDLVPRLFVVHEFLFPLVIVGLLTAHLMILWHQKHTDFPGPGKTETNIRGSRVWPQYAMKAGGLMMLVASVTFFMAGFIQINPVWLYGPFNTYNVSAGTQPDWYLGWQDGALRLWPHWEFRSFGHEIPNQFFPGLILPGILLTLMFAWPAIDRIIYKDHDRHNLLDRPRDKPFRTGVGAAAVVFFIDLTMACGTDLLANNLHIAFERLIEILQWGAFVGPIVAFFLAYRTCLALQRTGTHPIQRPIGGIIYRTAEGGYHTVGDVHAAHGDHAGDNGHAGVAHAGIDKASAAEHAPDPVAGD
ncbi:MAG TPA: cytochrome bc complex cytochrome b subunit [Acidimicrobiales bacterium]|jgi:ubiquinol-cytochrome c reductase cytochrome b subunit|nr:cytochrome bc complex cytochrome b subunit [Acidimicrobiales bacterium]